MHDVIYKSNGRDITMDVFIQIYVAIEIVQERMKIDLEEAVNQFYSSETYAILHNTENGLWGISARNIADKFLEEKENAEKNQLIMLRKAEICVEKEVWDKLFEAQKEMEYMREEAREKAIRDYNWQMKCAMRRGIEIGEKRGRERVRRIFQLDAEGKKPEEIAELCDVTVEKVLDVLE